MLIDNINFNKIITEIWASILQVDAHKNIYPQFAENPFNTVIVNTRIFYTIHIYGTFFYFKYLIFHASQIHDIVKYIEQKLECDSNSNN